MLTAGSGAAAGVVVGLAGLAGLVVADAVGDEPVAAGEPVADGVGVGDGLGVPVGVAGGVVVVGVGVPVGPGVGVPVGSGVGVPVGLGVGVPVGLGVALSDGVGSAVPGAAIAGMIRVAPKYSVHQIGEIFTTSPNVGAWTTLPLPMYMATWWIWRQSDGLVLKKIRSPGSSWLASTGCPAPYWLLATRGSFTPTDRYDANTSPEQSYEFGPSAAHSYGLPSWDRANATAASASGDACRPAMLVLAPRAAARLDS